MILSKKRKTKALIRLRGCAGWSAPVFFANHRRQVFSRRGPYVLVLLARYCKDIHLTVLFNTGVGNKGCLLNVNNMSQNMGGGKKFAVSTAIHCFTGCDTTSVFVSQTGRSYQTDRESLLLVHPNSKQGGKRAKLLCCAHR